MRHEIHYGKADVKVYRTLRRAADRHHADPRIAVQRARRTLLTAAEIEVIVRGTPSSTPTPRATTASSWRPTR